MAEHNIKIKILKYLLKKNIHDIFVSEVTVGNKLLSNQHARADIFTVSSKISIYEIKSEKDNLSRLVKQLDIYKLYANLVSVVVDEKFLNILDIDESIGIYVVKKNTISLIREPQYKKINQDKLSDYWTAQELDVFLFGCKGLSRFNKAKKLEYLQDILTYEQFYYATLYKLKSRYMNESKHIKELKEIKSRGMNPNQNITPLRRLSFSSLMP
jgi:hypothetical protein